MRNSDKNGSLIRRLAAIALCAFITFAYMPGLAYALEEQPDDTAAAEISLEDCSIEFDTLYYYGEVPFYSIDSKYAGETLTADDLGINVLYEGEVVDADRYELQFSYYSYDEEIGDIYPEIEPPLGVLDEDLEGGHAYTEYYVTATAAEGSGLSGETNRDDGYFCVRDKHSLQWLGAVVDFENGAPDSWRMRSRFHIGYGKMTTPVVAAIDDPGRALTENTDYIVTYYETAFDPDDNDPDGDGRDNEWYEYLVDDDEHRLSEMPTEPGHYFATIEGTGDYSGLGRVLFDITDYSPISIEYSGDALWSDGTKELKLNIRDGSSGDIRLSGIANTDWGNTVFEFELSEDSYEYDKDTGKLVIDGEAVFAAVRRGSWLDLNIDLVDSDNNLVARGFASFEFREARSDYDFEDDRDMVPGWDGSISAYRWAHEENSQYPEGIDGDYLVKSVRVTHGAELLDADIDDEGYLQRDGYEWYYRVKEWSPGFDYSAGPVEMEITYEDLNGEEKSYTVTLNVVPEIYEVRLESDDNRYDGLPGHSFDITAPARHIYFDEKGWYHDDAEDLTYKWSYAIGYDLEAQGKGNDGSRGWEPEWTAVPSGGLTDPFADFSVKSGDQSKGELKFKMLNDDQGHDEFYVRAALVDGDGSILASDWVEFRCHDEYTAIYPTTIEDLEVNDSTDYMTFEVRKYSVENDQSNGGYTTVDDPEFTWYFDEEGVRIDEKYTEGGNTYEAIVEDGQAARGNTFKMTRLREWDVNLRVGARWNDPDGRENWREQDYHFDWKNYDIWLERERDFVYTDGTATLELRGDVLETPDWMDKFDLVYKAGTGEWKYDSETDRDVFKWENKLTEGVHYSVSADGKTVTLNGDKLKDFVDQGICIMASLKIKGSDDVIRDTDEWCWVREPRIEYHYGDHEMLPGWGDGISGHDNMYVENGEYPDGEEFWYEVTSVEVTSGAELLSDDVITTSGGKTTLKKIIDESDSSNFWYDYRIKDLKDLDPKDLGDVTFKVNYTLDTEGKETGSFTFKVNVVMDIYEMHVDSMDGRDTGLPGDVIDLKASEVIHKYISENGEYQEEEAEAVYEWYCEWGDEEWFEINVDPDDGSIAHITLKEPEDRDDYWEGFGIGVRALSGGKVLTENSYGLNVASDYTEILPVRIDDLGIGESTDVELKAVRYSTTQGETDLTGMVQFRLFSEGGFIIEDNDGVVEHGELIKGTHIRITRTAHQYDRFDIRVEAPGSTIDEGDIYAFKEYWFSYAEPYLWNYDTVYKNSEDGWRLFGDFTNGSTLDAANEVDIVHDGKVLDPDYYDLKIFRSYYDEDADEQKEIDVTDSGVFTFYGNDSSSYYVVAVANEAGRAMGLEGETEEGRWIDLCSTTSLDPFGSEVYFEGRETTGGPHPQRSYYWFESGTSASPTVKLMDNVLTEGVDYEVFYVDENSGTEYESFPTQPGTYTCLVKAADGSGYTGENGLVSVVVMMEDGTINDIGYSEFDFDFEHGWPTFKYFYDFSFDEKYHVLEDIASTPYEDWFYVVPAGTKLDPIVKHGDKVIDPKYLKASYLEQEFDQNAEGGNGAWGTKDGATWLNEFPTEEGVYLCRLEGQSPYFGTYESFDLIRIYDSETEAIIADAEAAIAAAESASNAAETAQAAASSAAAGTADAVSKAQAAVTAAAEAEKAAQQAIDAANAALEAVKAAGYSEDSDAYKAAEKAVADATAVKKKADDRLTAANSALTKAQSNYNAAVAAAAARQGIPDSKIPKVKGVKKPAAKKTSITVKWTKFTKAQLKKSKATKYEIWVCPNAAFGPADTKIKTVSKSKSSAKISGLKKNTKYYVKVRAIRTVGSTKYVGKWSSRKTIKTPKK